MSELLARKTLRASSLVTMTLFGMVLVSLGLQRQALAQGTDMSAEDAKQYQDCLKLARLKPEDGLKAPSRGAIWAAVNRRNIALRSP